MLDSTRIRCNVVDSKNKVCFSGTRLSNNCYHWDSKVNMRNLSQSEEATLWHKWLGHISGTSIAKAVKAEAIVGLPLLSFNSRECCSNCPAGKQVKSSHKPTNQSSTTRILELLHIDLMGLMQTKSLKGKKYALVCVDDFSRYTWIKFIHEKSKTFKVCQTMCLQLQREKNVGITRIRSDHW